MAIQRTTDSKNRLLAQGPSSRTDRRARRPSLAAWLIFSWLSAVWLLVGPHALAQGELAGIRLSFVKHELMCIPIRFYGKDYSFLLDTGCSRTAVDTEFRARLGIPVGISRTKGSDGIVFLDRFRAPESTILGRPLRDLVEVVCTDLSGCRDTTGLDVHGILGMDVLRHQRFRIDFDRGEITFLASVPRDSGMPIDLGWTRAGIPTVIGCIRGIEDQTFSVDTASNAEGSVFSVLITQLLENGSAMPLQSNIRTSIVRSAVRRRVRLNELSVGEFRHVGLTFTEANLNLLGAGYLSRFVVTFDFPGGVMYLKPGADFLKPSRRELSGAQLWRPGGVTKVRLVLDGTPARRAGLQTDDVIEEVEGRPAASLRLSEIVSRLCVPRDCRLAIARGSQRFSITVFLDDRRGPVEQRSAALAPPFGDRAPSDERFRSKREGREP